MRWPPASASALPRAFGERPLNSWRRQGLRQRWGPLRLQTLGRLSRGMNAEHRVHPGLLQVDLAQAGGPLQVVQRDAGGEVVVAKAVADPAQVAVQERR